LKGGRPTRGPGPPSLARGDHGGARCALLGKSYVHHLWCAVCGLAVRVIRWHLASFSTTGPAQAHSFPVALAGVHLTSILRNHQIGALRRA